MLDLLFYSVLEFHSLKLTSTLKHLGFFNSSFIRSAVANIDAFPTAVRR